MLASSCSVATTCTACVTASWRTISILSKLSFATVSNYGMLGGLLGKRSMAEYTYIQCLSGLHEYNCEIGPGPRMRGFRQLLWSQEPRGSRGRPMPLAVGFNPTTAAVFSHHLSCIRSGKQSWPASTKNCLSLGLLATSTSPAGVNDEPFLLIGLCNLHASRLIRPRDIKICDDLSKIAALKAEGARSLPSLVS